MASWLAPCRLFRAGERLAEKVARIPRGLGPIVRDRAHDSEVDAREARRRVQIHGQRQIVTRLVIVRGQEPPKYLLAVHGWVLRRESRHQVHGGHALLDERVLVAADEDVLLGHRVGAKRIARTGGGLAYHVAERGVLRAERDD